MALQETISAQNELALNQHVAEAISAESARPEQKFGEIAVSAARFVATERIQVSTTPYGVQIVERGPALGYAPDFML